MMKLGQEKLRKRIKPTKVGKVKCRAGHLVRQKKRGNNDCNKGKQASTRARMKSAKAAASTRLERRKWEREVLSHLFFFSPSFIHPLPPLITHQDCWLPRNTHTHTHIH